METADRGSPTGRSGVYRGVWDSEETSRNRESRGRKRLGIKKRERAKLDEDRERDAVSKRQAKTDPQSVHTKPHNTLHV